MFKVLALLAIVYSQEERLLSTVPEIFKTALLSLQQISRQGECDTPDPGDEDFFE